MLNAKKANNILPFILCVWALTIDAQENGREIPMDTIKHYDFIHYEKNVIQNPGSLETFFKRLKSIENKQNRKLDIAHIGDSHIQADHFSGKVRVELQKRFGSAGRGVVFPYRLARTNSPRDVKSYSNVKWLSKRNVFPHIDMPTGLCGISVQSGDNSLIFKLGIDEQDSINYAFNRITIFNLKDSSSFDFAVNTCDSPNILEKTFIKEEKKYHTVRSGEYLGLIALKYNCSVNEIKSWNKLRSHMIYPKQKLLVQKRELIKGELKKEDFKEIGFFENSDLSVGKFSTELHLDSAVNFVFLRAVDKQASKKQTTIFGFYLEDTDDTGIVYNMIGVNGAQFKHYNSSEYFVEQLSEITPGLMIISLGTNEALDAKFDSAEFYKSIDTLIKNVSLLMPVSAILLTSPPDIFKRKKYKNPHAGIAARTIKKYAEKNNLAFWDFYEIMGGYGSMSLWKNARLSQHDKIHFTWDGYRVQGQILYEALMDAYDDF